MLIEKIIIIDYTYLIHASIFSYNSAMVKKENNPDLFVPPSTYTCLSMLIGTLKKIGVNFDTEDKIILAVDGRNSWRKEVEKSYKLGRQEQKEKAKFVNWELEYKKHNDLLEKIRNNTSFFVVGKDTLEADDWLAESVRFFKDNEIILATADSDMFQLLSYDNVKVYSPHPKRKSLPYIILDLDREKEKQKAYKLLMKKIEKEKTDNLTSEILTEKDYDKREQVVSLLTLPKEITNKIIPELERINETEKSGFNLDVFSPGIQRKFNELFKEDKEKIITYDYCKQLFLKRLNRKKSKGVKKDGNSK